MKVNLMLMNLSKKKVDEEETLSCDGPKYWLEEAQLLGISEPEVKLTRLNELVEDLDNVTRASRLCMTREQLDEVIKFALDEIAPRLSFQRLEIEWDEREKTGKNARNLAVKPKIGMVKAQLPMEFLRHQL